MRHRFFIDATLTEGDTLALTHDEQHHARVVRVRDGEEVEVFNGRGAASWRSTRPRDCRSLGRHRIVKRGGRSSGNGHHQSR